MKPATITALALVVEGTSRQARRAAALLARAQTEHAKAPTFLTKHAFAIARMDNRAARAASIAAKLALAVARANQPRT